MKPKIAKSTTTTETTTITTITTVFPSPSSLSIFKVHPSTLGEVFKYVIS